MAEKQKNQIIVIEPITKTVNDLLEALLEKDVAEVSPFQNADEGIQFARQFVPCMLVLCIQTNNDIPPVLNILKKLKPDIKQGHVKTLLVSKVKNPQLQKLIGEFGVTDYIEEPISARTLMFKANLQLKAVDTTRRQIEQKKLADEKIVFKSSKKGEDEAQNMGNEIKARQKPALQLANDTFLIKNSAIKKQAKKVVVELDGPDPSTGEWVPEGEDPANPAWRWKPLDKEDEPGSEEGDGWVCNGEKPQFKPATKKWQLSAEKPSLFFKKKNVKIAEKIGTDEEGEVVVADDSPEAEENLRKNLAKVQRQKKKKQAEAAGIPFVEEEEEAKPAAAKPAAPEAEEDEEGLDPIVKAERKAKRELAAKAPVAEKAEAAPEETKAEESAEPETAAQKKLEKLRRAREERKKAAIAAGQPVDPADEEPESKAAAPAAEAEEEEAQGAPAAIPAAKKERTPAPKAEGQLLDFLKKKKEAAVKPAENTEVKAEAEEPEEAAEEATASGRLAALRKRQREKKAKNPSEKPEEEPAEEAETKPESTTGEEPAEEELIKEPPPPAEEEEEEYEKELAALQKEKRRKREAKKKAILEAIEAEAEPSSKEIERQERKKKAKALGVEVEEEPEKERTERLERLQKNREELDTLEREAEEEEKSGVHLHTQQAEELKGMNVWDSDDSPAEDDPADKLLKKLKKDRKEKAAAGEKKEAADQEETEELEGSSEPAKKKKRKSGASTQAEGLEEIFSEDGEEAGEDLHAETGASANDTETTEEADSGESRSARLDRLRKKRDQGKKADEGEAASSDAGSEEELSAKKEFAEAEAEPLDAKKQKELAEAEPESFEAERKKELAEVETLDLTRKGGEKIAGASAEEKLKKKGESSESMKRFLERRKQKKAEFGLTDDKKNGGDDASGEAGQKRSFLGIFVSISDSFGVASERKLLNIFRAFESALENCAVALTEPKNGDAPLKVLFASSFEKGAEIPTAECRIETILDPSEQPAAQFVLRMLAPRTNFAEDESEAIERAMRALKPLVLQWLAAAKKEKAA